MTTQARTIVRQTARAKAMSEDDLQTSVTDMCDAYGLTWHHETDSRRSKAGFPDLVIVGRRVLFIELKTQGGRVRPEQHTWLTALARAEGVSAAVWRPLQWLDGSIQTTLRALKP